MSVDRSRPARVASFVMVAVAAMTTELAAADEMVPLVSLWPRFLVGGLWIVLAVLASYFLPGPVHDRARLPWYHGLGLATLFFLPLLTEPLTREWFGFGRPLEMQLVVGLRNLALGFAALSAWQVGQRMSGVAGLFLMLFGVAMCSRPLMVWLLAIYALSGGVWLALSYRARWLAAAEASAGVANEVERVPLRVPTRALIALGCFLALAVAVPIVAPNRVVAVLGELMPTSGGTGRYDPFSRGGVNDGDEETAGSDPRSTGFVNTDQFLDSPLPSLYDLSSDMFGEPVKCKEQERSIALSLGEIKELPQPPPDNQRPNRTFTTHRDSPERPRFPSSRTARALFEVQGRTPLHVRISGYDFFDGYRWHEEPPGVGTRKIEQEQDRRWMRVYRADRLQEYFAAPDRHEFRIAKLKGQLLPTPANLTRFRVGLIDQPDFFALGNDGVLRMAPREVPSGITVETQCRTVDPDRVDDLVSTSSTAHPKFTTLPEGLIHPRVPELVREWTSGLPRGVPQIQEVIRRLREEYIHDPDYREPDGCLDPLGHFLFESRRGADYHFASAATVLLRSLGYPCRMVTGFYVSPDHYDPETGHTPVVGEDLHCWTEYRLSDGDWLVLEPTPGYDTLGPNRTWTERLLAGLVAMGRWLLHHPIIASSVLLLTALAIWKRRRLIDYFQTWRWRARSHGAWSGCVCETCRLLERRSQWAGRSRKPGQTVSHWADETLRDPDGKELARMYQWAVYAKDITPPWSADQTRDLCQRVVNSWTLDRFTSA